MSTKYVDGLTSEFAGNRELFAKTVNLAFGPMQIMVERIDDLLRNFAMRLILVLFFTLAPSVGMAFLAQSPWLQPDVIKAAVDLELDANQLPLFRQSVTELMSNQVRATNRILRANNVADVQRRLETATKRQFKKLDRSVAKFLNEQQLARYANYRAALQRHLLHRGTHPGNGGSDALGGALAALSATTSR